MLVSNLANLRQIILSILMATKNYFTLTFNHNLNSLSLSHQLLTKLTTHATPITPPCRIIRTEMNDDD
jgi:hypothetical protein